MRDENKLGICLVEREKTYSEVDERAGVRWETADSVMAEVKDLQRRHRRKLPA